MRRDCMNSRKTSVRMRGNDMQLHTTIPACTVSRDTHKPSVGGSIPPVDTIRKEDPRIRGGLAVFVDLMWLRRLSTDNRKESEIDALPAYGGV